MKKSFILFLCFTLAIGTFAQEKKKSYWSVTLEAGANKFDGDIHQSYNDVIPNSVPKLTLGGSLEYTLTPVWSMGIEYYYLPMKAGYDLPQTNTWVYKMDSKMHNVDYFMAFNLLKGFYKHSKSKWGLWATIGAGMAFYDVNYETNGNTTPNNQGFKDANSSFSDGRALTVPVGALIEYNFTKNFALGTKIQYRSYNKDNLEGRENRGVTNDFVSLATLQLRWKFCAQKNDHTRNINLAQFNNDPTMSDLEKLQKQLNGIVIPPDPTDKLNDLDGRLKKLENYLDIDGPDDDNDGVANSRDQEPNTPAGNQVDFWGRTIPKGTTIDESAFIYFNFDKTDLDEEAHKAISLANEKLKADPNLMVEVRGFTDNMGSTPYNADLSQRRANVVKDELVRIYGIDPNRIVANGKGKYNPQDKVIPHRPYRTCIFFYSK